MRIFWFVLLKVAEIGGVVFGPLYLGRLAHCWTELFCYESEVTGIIDHCHDWMIGFGVLACTFIGGCVVVGLILFVCGNWKLAGKIRDRF